MLPTALTNRRRFTALLSMVAVAAGLLLATPGQPADATPVHDSDALYGQCGRVFTDPHAYWPTPAPPSGQSPFAKGNGVPPTCRALTFITYQEMIDGVEYLESQFPEFIEFYRLEDPPPDGFGTDTDCASSNSQENYCSAGLPQTGGTRQREELYMIRVTDERSATDSPGNLPLDDKQLFAFPLSIHGIERAGVEGGTRAAEDLATWAYCEAVANGETVHEPSALAAGAPNCDQEGTPHPLLEAQSDTPVPGENLSAGQALKQSASYFIYSNPDGWRRGEGLPGFYQRYNGNGVDLNRDWPNIGFTFKPYTPWSEPETKGFGEVLQDIRPQWDGGIDLHGQLIDRAFSFTLLGALPNGDYSQNQRILQTVRGAWADAEGRLGWSPHIKPNDAPPQPNDPRMYGVQWGTVWDTIDYTVTGAHGDWIASPIGLGADGIDNEMSFSHLANCGTGTCYEPVFEQMHIDGNKSLIYAMVNYSLLPEDDHFEAPGQVAYVTDDTRVVNPGTLDPGTEPPDLPTQTDIVGSLGPTNNFTFEFTVEGPDSTPAVYNGGLVGTASPNFALNGISPASVVSLVLERYRPVEENPDIATEDAGCAGEDDRWEEVNRYFNQSSIYLQAGEAVHTNSPTPGQWRICVTGDVLTNSLATGGFGLEIDFTEEEAFHLPPGGQAPYDVSNMDFFQDLKPNMDPGQLIGVSADSILSGETDLNDYTSLVIADDPFPGYSEISAAPSGPAQDPPPGSPHSNPGVGTGPCAYQRGDTDVPPGSNNPPPGCANSFEFDVDPAFNNQQLIVKLTSSNPGVNDWDLFVDRQGEDGGWSEAGRSTTPTGNETVTVFTPPPGHYRALVVNWSSADPSSAQTLDISFSNQYVGPPIVPSTRSPADLASWAGQLKAFVEGGGNLVLTDGAIKNLAYMGLVPREKIENFSVYAGYIGFTADGGDTSTYADPLAKDVNQPGAAEGPGHRHQTYEPVPLGYAIQDEGGSDFNSGPVWSVDQVAWESASGRTAGTTTDEKVTLGELPVGNGVVRIIGPVLPMPTEQYYHPFGLASYALTYSGYQVFNNALQWNRTTAPGGAGTGTAGGGVFIPKDCSRLKKLSGYNIVIGTTGKDKIKGTPGKDGLCGRAGKDVIRGLGNKDVLIGGKHRDKLIGGAGNDGLFAGKGNDLLKGGAGKDRLVGHKGRDRLIGGGGRNVLRGGVGQDFCRGGSGKDKFQGCEQQA